MIKKIFFCLFYLSVFNASASGTCNLFNDNLVVLLKLDDVVAAPVSDNSSGVSKKWDDIANYLEKNKIKASFGVIGESLEVENTKYFSWLNNRVKNDVIEFWNHGYKVIYKANSETSDIAEFNGTASEAQRESLDKTQKLAVKRFNTVLRGFGPHSSAVDLNTFNEIDRFPEIKYVWFYKPLDGKSRSTYVIKRTTELESPIFHPNFEIFKKTFDKRDKGLGYIALQGHPNQWDDAGRSAFFRVLEYLISRGAIFCKPSDVNFIN